MMIGIMLAIVGLGFVFIIAFVLLAAILYWWP